MADSNSSKPHSSDWVSQSVSPSYLVPESVEHDRVETDYQDERQEVTQYKEGSLQANNTSIS